MKILITGASGFVGRNLVNFFEEKHQVYALSRHVDYSSERVRFIKGDLSNLTELLELFSTSEFRGFDLIMHTASILADSSNLNDINVLNSNNILNHNVALLAIQVNCRRMINFSSSSIYPNIDGVYNERSIPNPALNRDAYYGLAKLNGEVLLDAHLLEKGILVTHLRLPMIYGPGVRDCRIWPVMEKELLENNVITVYGEGRRLINQIHINELFAILTEIIEKNLDGVYNLKAETLSILDLAKKIISEKGNENSRIQIENNGSKVRFELDCSKWESLK